MEVIENAADMRRWSRAHRVAGRRVAFVPTMGYLHDGHLSLVREAKNRADVVVVSIYVNPAQFAANEDFGTYPRDDEGDLAKLRALDVHAVFKPTHLYAQDRGRGPHGHAETSEGDPDAPSEPPHETYVTVENLQQGLCAITRPHFFRGVATVVAKLFNIVEPDVAVFGKKDYQQWRVIQRMVRDLDFDIDVVGMPLAREPDGLAMSSRNVRLTPENRKAARAINVTLREVAATPLGPLMPVDIIFVVVAAIEASGGTVDYVEIVDQKTLRSVESLAAGDKVVVLVAAKYGEVRLLDNVELGGEAE